MIKKIRKKKSFWWSIEYTPGQRFVTPWTTNLPQKKKWEMAIVYSIFLIIVLLMIWYAKYAKLI